MKLTSTELKIPLSEFHKVAEFYSDLLCFAGIGFTSSRMRLLIVGDDYLLLEAVNDSVYDAKYAADTQQVHLTTPTLHDTVSVWQQRGHRCAIASGSGGEVGLLHDPIGGLIQLHPSRSGPPTVRRSWRGRGPQSLTHAHSGA